MKRPLPCVYTQDIITVGKKRRVNKDRDGDTKRGKREGEKEKEREKEESSVRVLRRCVCLWCARDREEETHTDGERERETVRWKEMRRVCSTTEREPQDRDITETREPDATPRKQAVLHCRLVAGVIVR